VGGGPCREANYYLVVDLTSENLGLLTNKVYPGGGDVAKVRRQVSGGSELQQRIGGIGRKISV